MAQSTILGTDTVKDALKTKVNANDTELYGTKTEVENARDSEANLLAKQDAQDALITTVTTEVTNARDGEASLLDKQNAQDASIAALAAGSGVVVSVNDTTVGYVNGKLVAGTGIDFTENDDGGDESLTIASTALNDAVTNLETNLSVLQNNLILEAFRRMIGDSQTGTDAFQDGWVDALVDDSGIDNANSSNYFHRDSGYVEPIESPDTVGSEYEFEAGATSYVSCCEIDTNKIAIAYADDGASDGKCVIGTISGSVITFGTPVTFNTAASVHIKISKIDTNKILIAYGDGSDGQCIAATISGTVPTFGSEITFDADSPSWIACCPLATDKTLITYRDGIATSGECVVVTVSGTTCTAGTPVEFEPDSISFTDSCQISTDKAVITYSDAGDSSKGKSAVVTVSGTTPTIGTPVEFEAGTTTYTTCSKLSTSKVLIAYVDGGDGSYGKMIVGSISGTDIVFGSIVTFKGASVGYTGLVRIADNESLIIYNTGTVGETAVIYVTDTVPSIGTATSFETGSAPTYSSCAYISDQKAVIAFRAVADSNKGKAVVNDFTAQNMTLVMNDYEAESEPSESKALFIMEDTDTATINTDIKAYASNNDGSTYEQITLADEGDFETDQHIIVGAEEMTAVSDQTTKLKITTHNNKQIKIHALSNMLKL